MSLQDEVVQLQQHGLEKGIRMQETLQVGNAFQITSKGSTDKINKRITQQ